MEVLERSEFRKYLITSSVDLIATDPPYFKVKADVWDNQWKNKAEFFQWLETILAEYHRVLKPQGSIYLFAGPHLATEVELSIVKYFKLLNHLVWRKPTGRHQGCRKETLRRYFPQTEHILFAESRKKTAFAYESIRSHIDDARKAANVSRKQINEACACQMSGHWLDRSQWTMPSEKHYKTMNRLFGKTMKPYDQLRAEYKAIRPSRRSFAVTKAVPYTDVWDFKPVACPCEKPLGLMRHIIAASSCPGDVVLDTFAGSGSTAIAARDLGRRFIGCEMGKQEFHMAMNRIDTTTDSN